MISKKVILTGSFGVGKTSLFNQFLFKKFSDKYLTTIGVKVDKKVVEVEGDEVTLLVWDIAGEVSQDKIPASYFLGASGVIYVMDLTRPSTFSFIETDFHFLRELMPDGVLMLAANKKDLVSIDDIKEIERELPLTIDFLTSAKTGENVEDLFYELSKRLIYQTKNV
jgi:small GTP-binding protein